MAVRTGGPGPGGLSMLVVPLLDTPGVTMRRIRVGGQSAAGTTFIELDDVKVPVENLIGQEGMGMKYGTSPSTLAHLHNSPSTSANPPTSSNAKL
jgi:acyl-CoA dehydrogenase